MPCLKKGASSKPRTPHGTKANTPVLATTITNVETNYPCKGDLIDLCPSSSFTYINGDPADLDFFYRYKGIQYSKCPLQPTPPILPMRILTRIALLLLHFRTTGTLPRLVHQTPLLLWARAVLLPWLLTASYSLMLSNVHLAPRVRDRLRKLYKPRAKGDSLDAG